MATNIRLMVDNKSGVLAALVNELRGMGIKVKSHNLEAINNSASMLSLNAESSGNLDEQEVRTKLMDSEVVQNVEAISLSQTAQPSQSATVEVPAELVERVVGSYPKIMSHIQSYEEQLAKDPNKAEKLKQLGVDTGRKMLAGSSVGEVDSSDAVIGDVILPRIDSIAEASREGDTIVVPVSLFSRRAVTSMDLMGGEDDQCYFLCGLMEGLASSVPGFESASVDETRCRSNGDPSCVFQLK